MNDLKKYLEAAMRDKELVEKDKERLWILLDAANAKIQALEAKLSAHEAVSQRIRDMEEEIQRLKQPESHQDSGKPAAELKQGSF